MKKRILIAIIIILGVVGLAKVCIPKEDASSNVAKTSQSSKPRRQLSEAEKARPYKDPKDLAPEGSWNKKSEKKKYPSVSNPKDIVVRVSLKGNRTYIIKRGRIVYTMLSTAGVFKKGKSLTPTGTYTIQDSKGDSFFNYNLNEGANNWTSWDPDNVYLFHSVPTKDDGQYNMKEAKKLGRTQGSHGCVRLSVPDSKWFMNHIQPGTKVIIENK